jgi:excisionase family DNA binding protein
MPNIDHYLTIPEAAKRLNIGESKARRAIAAGDLLVVRFGHRTVRVSEAAVRAYAKKSTEPKRKRQNPGWRKP